MAVKVVLFSPDPVRGRVLSRTLTFGSVEHTLFSLPQEACREFFDSAAPVLIYDAKENAESALRTLERRLPPSLLPRRIVVLTEHDRAPGMERLARPGIVQISDPLAPEYILTLVKDLVALQKTVSPRKLRLKARKVLRPLPRILLRAAVVLLVLGLAAGGGFLYWCLSNLPNINQLGEYAPYETSKLYSASNTLLAEFFIEKRTFLPADKIPALVKNAFIAVEDSKYYEHSGVDFVRIAGAAIKDLKRGGPAEGGSTITQQLVKRLYLTPEKSIVRKIQEIALAVKLEKKYAKDEILGLYLNQAFFGANAYGIEAAAGAYFGKSTADLDAAEAALLAAILKAPAAYSPFKNPERAKQRRDLVLQKMVVKGFIPQPEYLRALGEPIPTRSQASRYRAPYFVDYCRSLLEPRYGDRLLTAGMTIYTTLDDKLQQKAENAVTEGVRAMAKRGLTGVQAALLAVEIDTGRIKAMVGGTDFWESQFNRVTQAMRQPGSAFKPIVYLTALMKGYKPEDLILDEETTYMVGGKPWTPHNFSPTYNGIVTLDQALTYSLNAATVCLANEIRMASVLETARRLGIRSKVYPYLSSALGASELTLMELVCAYASLAKGTRVEPTALDRIVDRKQFSAAETAAPAEKVIPPEVVSSLNLMLKNVILEGTATPALVLNRPLYGKTGTTNDFTDGWFVGYDDKLAVGVWVGRDNHTPLGDQETGSRTALPIWIEFMK